MLLREPQVYLLFISVGMGYFMLNSAYKLNNSTPYVNAIAIFQETRLCLVPIVNVGLKCQQVLYSSHRIQGYSKGFRFLKKYLTRKLRSRHAN